MNRKIVITSPVPATPTKAFMDAFPAEYDWIIIDDSNGKLDLPKRKNIFVYDYAAQKKILGRHYNDYRAFHKSASCRNLAHFLAYQQGYDVAVSLDYDCVVPANFVEEHLKAFSGKPIPAAETASGWINPLENRKWFSRGFPYSARNSREKPAIKKSDKRVVLNMGLWKNVVDINGIDKVLEQAPQEFPLQRSHTGVAGVTPLCGMNNSFARDIIPAYFFLPNFHLDGWEISRHDDIWGGYILQKLVQKKGDIITYGRPVVHHERESSQPHVLHYEHYMHILEPYFYGLVDAAVKGVKKSDYQTMFANFADNFEALVRKNTLNIPEKYLEGFRHQSKYITLWKQIFQEH